MAYPDADTTVDAVCETVGFDGTADYVLICDFHDELASSLVILIAVVVFAVGFAIVTVALK